MSKTGTYIVNLREKYKEVMMDCEDLVKPFFCGLSGRECNINNCPKWNEDFVYENQA